MRIRIRIKTKFTSSYATRRGLQIQDQIFTTMQYKQTAIHLPHPHLLPIFPYLCILRKVSTNNTLSSHYSPSLLHPCLCSTLLQHTDTGHRHRRKIKRIVVIYHHILPCSMFDSNSSIQCQYITNNIQVHYTQDSYSYERQWSRVLLQM